MPVEINANSPPPSEGGPPPRPRFSIAGYSGDPVQVANFSYPVVVELSGVQVSRNNLPILLDHDISRPLGVAENVRVDASGIYAAGTFTGDTGDSAHVVGHAKNGFPWQASIGAKPIRREFVEAGKSAIVNGREMRGPLIVARQSILYEISITAIGADPKTSAAIAAFHTDAGGTMDGAQTPPTIPAGTATPPANPPVQAAQPPAGTPLPADILAAERARVAAVARACEGYPDIAAKAISEGWEPGVAALAVVAEIRARRPTGLPPAVPAIHMADKAIDGQAIECSMLRAAGYSRAADSYTDEIKAKADLPQHRYAGIQSTFADVVRATGKSMPSGRFRDEHIRAAFQADREIRASGGFSTVSLPGIMSNVANKTLMQAYTSVNVIWNRIAQTVSHTDFKTKTWYRFNMAGLLDEIGDGGEFQHTTFGETSYTNSLKTYGRSVALTRKDIINDDLGAFLRIPAELGRVSALKLERDVFVLLLSNPTTGSGSLSGAFYSSTHSNYMEGATTTLSISTLTDLEKLFLDQKDENGNPILVMPKLLLVPTALKTYAEQLMSDRVVNETTTANKPSPASNPHAGKFTVACSPYLSTSTITGYSSTAFRLFADPSDIPAMFVGFLNGQQSPTIESTDADFDTLGIRFRTYYDYGISLGDWRGTAMSKGAT